MAGAIERWECKYRELAQIDPESAFSDSFKKTTLKQLLIGGIKEFVERDTETTNFDQLREQIMKRALRKRQEHCRSSLAMEVGKASQGMGRQGTRAAEGSADSQ